MNQSSLKEIVHSLILVYSIPLESTIVEFEFVREFTSDTAPLHALTRIGERARPEWERLKRCFPVPIDEYFFQKLPPFIQKDIGLVAIAGKEAHIEIPAPCVVAQLFRPGKREHRVVLNEKQIKACKGDLKLFGNVLNQILLLNNLEPRRPRSPIRAPLPKRLA